MKNIYLKHRRHFFSFPTESLNVKKRKASIIKTLIFSKKSIKLITLNGITTIRNKNNVSKSVVFNGTLVRSSLDIQFDLNYPGVLLF